MSPMHPPDRLHWSWIAAGWLIVALAWTPASMLASFTQPSFAALFESGAYNLLNFACWALATPGLFRLCRVLPLGDGRNVRHAALLLIAGVVIVAGVTSIVPALQLLWAQLTGAALPARAYDPAAWAQRILVTSLFAVPTYIAVIAIGQTLVWAARARMREAEVAHAEMRALRAELNPHFLFNTLAGIGRLAHEAPDRAEHAVHRLADVLRNSLSDAGPRQTLAEAVGEVEEHLALYRVLHGDVRFEREVEEGLWQATLPARLLVPLVENSMTHGARDAAGVRWIKLRTVRASATAVQLTLSNPAPAPTTVSHGLSSGLASTQRLLAIHHGEAATMDYWRGDGIFTVRLTVPQ